MAYTLEQKSAKTIDLLITEFQMPEMTGIEVIKEIMTFLQLKIVTNQKSRSNQRKELKPPVIFMCSGYQLQNLIEQCKKKGVKEFLEKPIRRPQLRDALRKYNFIP